MGVTPSSIPPQLLVLGGGLEADGSPNAATQSRAEAAAEFYAEHGEAIRLVVYSGSSSPLDTYDQSSAHSEAAHMAEYGQQHGIPAEIISVESKSRSTIANLALTANMFGVEPIGLITGQGTMPRALKTAQRVWGGQFDIVPLPVPEPEDRLRHAQEQISTWVMQATLLGVAPGDTQTALHRTENFHRVAGHMAPLLRRTLHRRHSASRSS